MTEIVFVKHLFGANFGPSADMEGEGLQALGLLTRVCLTSFLAAPFTHSVTDVFLDLQTEK